MADPIMRRFGPWFGGSGRETKPGEILAAAISALPDAIAPFSIVSCDVFDTAVIRRLARPEDVHLLTGLRAASLGLLRCSAEAFQPLRIEAERAARADAIAAGHDEVRIQEVFNYLYECGIVTDITRMAELEVAVECDVCVPVVAVRDILNQETARRRLIYLSDTILSGVAIRAILMRNGYTGGFEVITSSDTRRNKASGRLFPHLIGIAGCLPHEILHIGDNPVSDIGRAKAHGIETYYLPRRRSPPEQDQLSAKAPLVRLLHSHRRSAAAAAARELKAAVPAIELGRADPARGLTGGVPAHDLHRLASILAIGFTLFVLAEARRRGIKRIYFLARDGHLPITIARRLTARTGDDFDLRYLRVSRQAIMVPSMADDLPALAMRIGDRMLNSPLSTALDFLKIDSAVTTGILRDLGLDPETRPGVTRDFAPIQRLFAAAGPLITAPLQERRAAALGYLGQEGFLEPGPRLIVDVGWRGSTQKGFSPLTGIPDDDIVGCYVGLLADALGPRIGPANTACYLFGFGNPKPLTNTVLDGYALLELLLSAPQGSVSHYEWTAARPDLMEAPRAAPVEFAEGEPGASRRRQTAEAIEHACLDEFEAMDQLLDGAWPETIDPASALFDLERPLTRPSRADINMINTIPFIQDVGRTISHVPVNPVPWHELLRSPHRAIQRISRSPWRAGAVRASLPWPIPDMTFADFKHRAERLASIFGLS